jgi:hypothetical protein
MKLLEKRMLAAVLSDLPHSGFRHSRVKSHDQYGPPGVGVGPVPGIFGGAVGDLYEFPQAVYVTAATTSNTIPSSFFMETS